MNELVNLKNSIDDFDVEFDIITPIDLSNEEDQRRIKISNELESLESQIELNQQKIDEINKHIDKLTNHADGIDYAIAVTCGIVTGLFDSFIVGEWNFDKAKKESNKEINEKVINFAKKDPEYMKFLKGNKDPNRLNNAIQFLEEKYKLPGDGAYQNFKGMGVYAKTHHLDDFCHHPTLIGLICSILVQFTGMAKYRTSNGRTIKVAIEVNEYGKLVSEEKWGKVFAGIINWFFTIAQTIQNQKGHLMSDIAGSSTSVGKGNEGAGLPGSFLSLAKELSSLPCFKNTDFAENLRRAYQNGVGTGNKQLDLGVFNALFEGEYSNKLDMRTEMAIKKELKRQSVPVVLNEILVRGVYFIRRFIQQMKYKDSILDLDWKDVLPLNNRTIVRMMTIASGTFMAIDMTDATVRSAIKSSGINPAFLKNFILRVNFVGIGRFAIACGIDTSMGIKRSRLRDERIELYEQQIALTDAKVFYKQADMWISAENTGKTIEVAYDMMEKTTVYFIESIQEIYNDLDNISQYSQMAEEKNPGLIDDILDILENGGDFL